MRTVGQLALPGDVVRPFGSDWPTRRTSESAIRAPRICVFGDQVEPDTLWRSLYNGRNTGILGRNDGRLSNDGTSSRR